MIETDPAILKYELVEYVLIALYEKELVLQYTNSVELALAYQMGTQEEAEEGFEFCVNLIKELEFAPEYKKEEAHKYWSITYLNNKKTPVIIY